MKKQITKYYSNGEATIVWQPHLCIHSAICAKGLPSVFQPKERPWIKQDAATTQELINQVAKCPSGALSTMAASELPEKGEEKQKQDTVQAVLMKNGPLLVHCDIEIADAEGNKILREKMTAFCRCGASVNKPFCDGSHGRVGFEG